VNVYQLIKAKRDGLALTREEIELLISGFTKGEIPDYQFAAFLMAVFLRGMTFQETTHLTMAMMNSGKVFDLSDLPGLKIDKHSTGGVGDTVSLILAPLVAACGVIVPMVSGRGLGHTGGTLDKLESIPGFRTDLSYREFRTSLKAIGCAMTGPTRELAPADKKIYALRDVTATVDSIPLIAASIMSKKLAEGIDGLVLDVKTGSGAFMPRRSDARKLAQTMIEIGTRMGRKMVAVITRIDQPLGRAVGNALEVIETLEALKGRGEPDLMEVTLELGIEMLVMAGCKSRPAAAQKLSTALSDGSALRCFRRLVSRQGGDQRVGDDYARLPAARYAVKARAPDSGFVQALDTLRIGMLAVRLGAGRARKEDKIDPAVGFWFRRKIGDRVLEGDVLADVRINNRKLGQEIARELAECYQVGRTRVKPPRLIIERLGGK
jgi:pyrimidine-nucleoside phosphorylase